MAYDLRQNLKLKVAAALNKLKHEALANGVDPAELADEIGVHDTAQGVEVVFMAASKPAARPAPKKTSKSEDDE